jgi:plastocyanin
MPDMGRCRKFMAIGLTLLVAASSGAASPHTIVSDTGLFRSGSLDTNESFTFRFDRPGTCHYACSNHPRMVGTIVVE